MKLHVGLVAQNKLWHTVRNEDGSWTGFGDVADVVLGENPGTPNPGNITDVACAGFEGQLHLCSVNSLEQSGVPFHTLRRTNGTWFPFGNVESEVRAEARTNNVDPGIGPTVLFVCVGAEIASNGDLHFGSGVRQEGTAGEPLHRTVRSTDGMWSPFSNHGGSFAHIDFAMVREELHVCGITSSVQGEPASVLQHAIVPLRGGPAVYSNIRALVIADNPASPKPGPEFSFVSCARSATNELHLCTSASSALWHTMRRADGTWLAFGDVNAAILGEHPESEDPSAGGAFGPVACVEVDNEMHLCVATESALWHTIRRRDGTWFPWGDAGSVILAQNPGTPNPGRVRAIAVAQV